MENKLKISVVTVCYNAVDTIEETILSVINQTYDNVEYIIIDGGSTDGTVDIIKKYANHIVYWVSEPDRGIYDAMNKGIAVATGDYINFMNAGDCFANKNILAKIASISNDFDVLYGDSIVKYDFGNFYSKSHFFEKNDSCLPFNHQSSYVKRRLILNGFDLKYKIAADYALFYRLYSNGHSFKYIPSSLSIYDMQGFSSKHKIKTFLEVREINGTNSSISYYSDLIKVLFKTFTLKILPHDILKYYRISKYQKAPY